MTIAIFGSYSYWNDGIAWKDFSARGEGLQEVVIAASDIWFERKEDFRVEDAIGADAKEVLALIEARYNELVENDKRKRRIDTLKVSIRHCEQWLSNVDLETVRLTQLLKDNQIELEGLIR